MSLSLSPVLSFSLWRVGDKPHQREERDTGAGRVRVHRERFVFDWMDELWP